MQTNKVRRDTESKLRVRTLKRKTPGPSPRVQIPGFKPNLGFVSDIVCED